MGFSGVETTRVGCSESGCLMVGGEGVVSVAEGSVAALSAFCGDDELLSLPAACVVLAAGARGCACSSAEIAAAGGGALVVVTVSPPLLAGCMGEGKSSPRVFLS